MTSHLQKNIEIIQTHAEYVPDSIVALKTTHSKITWSSFRRILAFALLLIAASSVAQAADSTLEIDIPYIMNLDVVSLSGRFRNDSAWRDEITLQIPFTLMKAARNKEYAAHFSFYIAGATFFNYQAIDTSTTGFGRFYVTIHDEDNKQTFIPFVTVYRAQTLEYTDGLGTKQHVNQDNFLTPGLILGYGISDTASFHLDFEANSYEKFSHNYQLRTGLAYQMTPDWRVSVGTEERSWDYSRTSTDQRLDLNGVSHATVLRFIRKIKPDSYTPYTHFTVSLGQEDLINHSDSPLLQNGNLDRLGYFFQIGVSVGKLMW